MEASILKPVNLFCPNCGKKITGYLGADGSLRIICDKCKVVIFSKHHKRKELNLKIVANN